MTNDELRALADALEPMARAPRFEDFDVQGFCAWVRACADAPSLPGLAPTHRCPACGAFWRQCDDASWNLRSASCCGLCDAGRVELVCWLDEPKREPLSDQQLASLYLQWDERPGVSFVDLMRAVERAAYKRAAQECDPHDDDDSIDRQIKREVAERIRALGRE